MCSKLPFSYITNLSKGYTSEEATINIKIKYTIIIRLNNRSKGILSKRNIERVDLDKCHVELYRGSSHLEG
jgi:hypothetical protein